MTTIGVTLARVTGRLKGDRTFPEAVVFETCSSKRATKVMTGHCIGLHGINGIAYRPPEKFLIAPSVTDNNFRSTPLI